MLAQIQKCKNCLWVYIPDSIAQELHLTKGTQVNLVIQPSKYSLENMLDAITAENQHRVLFDDHFN